MNAWSLIGFGANVSVIVMALAWAVARRLKNASLIEPAWTYGFAIVACLYALIGSGTPFRKSLIEHASGNRAPAGHHLASPDGERPLRIAARTVPQTALAHVLWIFPIPGRSALASFNSLCDRLFEYGSRNQWVGGHRVDSLARRYYRGHRVKIPNCSISIRPRQFRKSMRDRALAIFAPPGRLRSLGHLDRLFPVRARFSVGLDHILLSVARSSFDDQIDRNSRFGSAMPEIFSR